ncbi:inorganic phosphate transporter Pho88 [Limtongia smithiae]|uniref:inorganic phosphate transporter Pho88 n=1 Tax=Limtongia smithiae TaxID=1125753 RepID=UPI0034CE71C5
MNAAVSQMVLMFGLMQVSKRIPFDDPKVVNYARLAYLASNIFIFALYVVCLLKIKRKNDLTMLKYVEPASPLAGSNAEKKFVTTTVKEYDQQQVVSAMRSSLFGIAILLFMHLRLGYTNPLVMQTVMPLKSIFEQKIIQIHVLGKAPVDDLKRPFKAAAGLFGMGAPAVETDKKTIAQAETSGRGGAKEE